jgi:putative addiction module antidote
MHTVKVTTVGDSIEIVLPKAALGHLQLEDGDELQVQETSRGLELTVCDDELARQFEVAKAFMKERHEVLRKLAE